MKSASILVTIDQRLRYTLFGLHCALDVNLSGVEIERVFADAQNDQVSPKEYTLYSDTKIVVRISVDEYESESALIRVQSKALSQKRLEQIHEDAGYYHFRQRQAIEEEITIKGAANPAQQ